MGLPIKLSDYYALEESGISKPEMDNTIKTTISTLEYRQGQLLPFYLTITTVFAFLTTIANLGILYSKDLFPTSSDVILNMFFGFEVCWGFCVGLIGTSHLISNKNQIKFLQKLLTGSHSLAESSRPEPYHHPELPIKESRG